MFLVKKTVEMRDVSWEGDMRGILGCGRVVGKQILGWEDLALLRFGVGDEIIFFNEIQKMLKQNKITPKPFFPKQSISIDAT